MFESLLSIKAIYFEAVEIFRTIGQIQRFCTPLYSTGWGILIFVCRWSQYNILNTQLIHFGKSEVKQKERETDKKKPLIVPRGSVRTLLITTFQLVIHISSLIFTLFVVLISPTLSLQTIQAYMGINDHAKGTFSNFPKPAEGFLR